MKEKEKVMTEIVTTQMEDVAVIVKAILAEEDAEDAEEAAVDAVEEETTIVSIWKMLNVSTVAKRATILLTVHSQEKMIMISQTWLLIPQVRPAHKYPNSYWEIIHPLGG
jgi:hypothetical protein